MTKRSAFLIAAAFLTLGIAGATAGELPSYDVAGLPISPLQMSVLGTSGAVQEHLATPAPMIEGMPVSPHQIAVLGQRTRTTAQPMQPFEAAETQIGPVTRAQ